jgi:hypothetical protein
MSADNGVIVQKLKHRYRVIYYSGDSISNSWEFTTLRKAVSKAKELNIEFQTEYGIDFI